MEINKGQEAVESNNAWGLVESKNGQEFVESNNGWEVVESKSELGNCVM